MERININVRPRQIVKATVIAYVTIAVMDMLARKLNPFVKDATVWLEATK